MRIARNLALLVALCFAITSLASASSYGPTASKGSSNGKSGSTKHFPNYPCLYCANGYFTGQTDGWTINFGYSVSDSFTVPYNSTMTEAALLSWNFPGTILNSVDYAVGTSPFASNVGSGVSSGMSLLNFGYNQYGYDLQGDYFNTSPTALQAGKTYWFTLYNASATNGYPIYWDQNSGPSSAYESAVGNLQPVCGITFPGPLGGTCSETFIIGGNGRTTPEPGSLMLLGSGLLGLGGVIRRRLAK